MNNFLEQKKNILIDWLLRNNIDIQNTMNAQTGVQGYQREAIFNANIITSVLLKEKIFDSGFDGLETLLETDSEIITNLRECTKMEELLNILNTEEFRNIGSTFSANQVLGIYSREKEYGNIDTNINNNNYEPNKENNYNSKTAENNQYENYSYNNYTQNNLNTNQHQNEKQTYNRNINFSNNGKNNFNQSPYQYNNQSYAHNINRPNQVYEKYNTADMYNSNNIYEQYIDDDYYIHSNGKQNKEAIYEHGLNHVINGIKTITHKLNNGNYSFEMILPVGSKGETQSVNKKTLTKEEHERFIDTYENEILGIEKDYSYGKYMDNELHNDMNYSR